MPKGQCNCGEVAYQVNVELKDVYVCHCSICRRATGSGGIAVTVISKENFQWTKGEEFLANWQKPNHDWENSFCKNCGSLLPAKDSDTHIYIPVGTLTSGDGDLRVAHHIWVGSKANWEEIGDDGKLHYENFQS
ncbi:MAG: GFA family protein [Kangiellaceae bacterium]|nr:GFA family protein [Kangiellaceae bacterium]